MTKSELYNKLNRIADLDDALRIIAIKIERLETCAQGHAIRYDQDKVQTSPSDPVSRIMDDLYKLLDRQKELQIQMAEAVEETSALIDLAPNKKQRLVLYYHYVQGLRWAKIAEKLHVYERHVYRLRDEGIDAIMRSFQK